MPQTALHKTCTPGRTQTLTAYTTHPQPALLHAYSRLPASPTHAIPHPRLQPPARTTQQPTPPFQMDAGDLSAAMGGSDKPYGTGYSTLVSNELCMRLEAIKEGGQVQLAQCNPVAPALDQVREGWREGGGGAERVRVAMWCDASRPSVCWGRNSFCAEQLEGRVGAVRMRCALVARLQSTAEAPYAMWCSAGRVCTTRRSADRRPDPLVTVLSYRRSSSSLRRRSRLARRVSMGPC